MWEAEGMKKLIFKFFLNDIFCAAKDEIGQSPMKSKMHAFWMKEEPDQLAKSKIWSWYPEPWHSRHLAPLGSITK